MGHSKRELTKFYRKTLISSECNALDLEHLIFAFYSKALRQRVNFDKSITTENASRNGIKYE